MLRSALVNSNIMISYLLSRVSSQLHLLLLLLAICPAYVIRAKLTLLIAKQGPLLVVGILRSKLQILFVVSLRLFNRHKVIFIPSQLVKNVEFGHLSCVVLEPHVSFVEERPSIRAEEQELPGYVADVLDHPCVIER